jgi:two-component system response regulator DesR
VNEYPIKVVVIDDHRVVADALIALLEANEQIKVAAKVTDPNQIVDAISTHKPNVAVCDLEMPGGDPLERAAEGINLSPETNLLVLTAYPTDAHITRALDMGVKGFLTKNEPAEAVVDGIHAIFSGHSIYSEDVRTRMIMPEGSQAEMKLLTLTPRELSVVRLVALGMTTAQIADQINRSPKTIDNQISSALAKTNSSNRVELSRWAIREGLVVA